MPVKINRVIPLNLINKLRLQKFQIGLIQAKYANKLIQILKGLQTLPTDTYFLKRIKKLQSYSNEEEIEKTSPHYVQVLLCLSSEKDQYLPQIQETIREAFEQNILEKIITKQLPRDAPSSKKDFVTWAKIWPCTFIEPQCVKDIPHQKEQVELLEMLFQEIKNEKFEDNYILSTRTKRLISLEQGQKRYSCDNPNPMDHPIIRLAGVWPQSSAFKEKQNQFYYLTGLSLFIKSSKLCGMCAMGLVHSRIERVYFVEDSVPPQQILQIMHCPKMNHKIDILSLTFQ